MTLRCGKTGIDKKNDLKKKGVYLLKEKVRDGMERKREGKKQTTWHGHHFKNSKRFFKICRMMMMTC